MAQDNDIETLISAFTEQLTVAIRRSALQQVVSALGGNAPASSGKRRGRPPGSKNAMPGAKSVRITRAPKGSRRSADDVARMGEALFAHVNANPGLRAEQIAKSLNTDVDTMRLPMKALMAAKKVKSHGQRRGTTYFASGAKPAAASASAKQGKKKRRSRKKATSKAK